MHDFIKRKKHPLPPPPPLLLITVTQWGLVTYFTEQGKEILIHLTVKIILTPFRPLR